MFALKFCFHENLVIFIFAWFVKVFGRITTETEVRFLRGVAGDGFFVTTQRLENIKENASSAS